MKKNNGSYLAYPYVIWSAIFIVVPLLLILFYGFTVMEGGSYIFSLDNFIKLFSEEAYIRVFLRSMNLALQSTVICLMLGYPVAYIISKMDINKRQTVILLFILPMWMNFLLRTYAWASLLGNNGIINTFIKSLGFEPIKILYTDAAVLLGMVYNFLPFMVLPIYTVLSKIDENLINAAHDLGANKFQVFTKIIFPLSLPGVASGVTMVFMPAVSTFIISKLLGGGQFMLLGNLIEQQFMVTGDKNFGSSVSILMMIIILISMGIMSRFDKDNEKEGGGLLF
ncbi:MAG: ABC transporter permease [Peptostreptococcaceae bacterium]